MISLLERLLGIDKIREREAKLMEDYRQLQRSYLQLQEDLQKEKSEAEAEAHFLLGRKEAYKKVVFGFPLQTGHFIVLGINCLGKTPFYDSYWELIVKDGSRNIHRVEITRTDDESGKRILDELKGMSPVSIEEMVAELDEKPVINYD